MSYILEALKKAEQQRELGRVPGIDSVHEQPHRGGRASWLWLMISVLILNLLALLVLFWPDANEEGAPQAVPQTVSPSPQAPQQKPAQRPKRAPETEQTLQPEASSIAGPAARRPAEPPSEARLRLPVTAPAARAEAKTPPASVEMPAAADPAPQLPVWPQVPASLFEQLKGNLRLDVHVFAGQPADRFVLINLKKYQQGQRLQEGPRLDEITADGVILSFRGERFRLQAKQ
jgi:general secretion pathway protein B